MRRSAVRESAKASCFTESVIREMSRVAREHDAINLAQGFPDFAAPVELKEAAVRWIRADLNQYAVTWGSDRLRAAIGEYMQKRRGVTIDPDTQVTVCCGATEAMIAAIMGVLDPGDEFLVPEPYYENYGPDGILSGAVPLFVPLGDGFTLDIDAMKRASGPKTRAVILNTPHNPTGRVFSPAEITALCDFIKERDMLLFTDEIYEEILFTGPHRTPLLEPDMAERTIVISGASKTFSVTGWRVGWIISPPSLTSGIRKVHDFLTVGAPAPLQEAIAEAMLWDDAYFEQLRADYVERRKLMVDGLNDAGFTCEMPEGAYYAMVDIRPFQKRDESDVDFAMRLVREAGVATVPGSSFFDDPEDGEHMVRFCYSKKPETLIEANRRLKEWSAKQ
ncbi:MAG: aminotransferase class I/II-fold pyridoxal phosphate-dependent enzyme [Planctomycetes bacterium]|nr:aminotransferase class I/II-fold pyridoxal phosphate-dependent enzyme [Planctomycetota bacterium]MCP4770102.1 aminotransferase class I/II-fold pyridoxal phosphate-dependent enzyme [Planctomycetota bacterium]MCP4860750.1 aminotransferase class I/II-fold pyridoxal phosphate-dependent enzyme [Planctomycetota bacterium]